MKRKAENPPLQRSESLVEYENHIGNYHFEGLSITARELRAISNAYRVVEASSIPESVKESNIENTLKEKNLFSRASVKEIIEACEGVEDSRETETVRLKESINEAVNNPDVMDGNNALFALHSGLKENPSADFNSKMETVKAEVTGIEERFDNAMAEAQTAYDAAVAKAEEDKRKQLSINKSKMVIIKSYESIHDPLLQHIPEIINICEKIKKRKDLPK